MPIYWLLGDQIADDYEDFYNGGWDSNAPRTEAGGPITSPHTHLRYLQVWTGTSADGTPQSDQQLGHSVRVAYGEPESQGSELYTGATVNRNIGAFYALSDVFQVAEPVGQPVPSNWSLIPAGLGPGDSFRLLFVREL